METKEYSRYHFYDLIFISSSIGTYILDIVTDVLLAISYYRNQQIGAFIITTLIIIITSLILNIFSLFWLVKDSKLKESISICGWIVQIAFITFQCGPIMNYSYLFYYAFISLVSKSDANIKYYTSLATYYDHDSSLLRIFETYIESLPQLMIQIYMFFTCRKCHSLAIINVEIIYLQIISVISSWISIAWSITSYYRILRFSNKNKKNVTKKASIVYFIWKFFSIGSRALILAMFSIRFTHIFFIFLLIHWSIMTLWIIMQKSTFCQLNVSENKSHSCNELFYATLMGIVFIFSYLNVVDGKTRNKITFFYIILYVENISLLFLWFFYASNVDDGIRWGILTFSFISFCFDIFFMLLYYIFYHPITQTPFKHHHQTSNDKDITNTPHMDNKINQQSQKIMNHIFDTHSLYTDLTKTSKILI